MGELLAKTYYSKNSSFPMQTSLYGASKLASEGLIQQLIQTDMIKLYL